jgi:drug/metabolite transporter (DMT)-like permease
MAMLVNGAASRLLTPRFAVPNSSSSSPLSGVALAVVGADPVFLLSSFRVLATLLLLAVMFAAGDIPSDLRAARARMFARLRGAGATSSSSSSSSSSSPPPPVALPKGYDDPAASPPPTPIAVVEPLAPLRVETEHASNPSPPPPPPPPPSSSSSSRLSASQITVPVAIGATNALGYLPYMVLCSMDGVALWSALVGLYVVIPVAYGVFARGEARTPKKLVGIAACVVAGVLLGLPAGDDDGGGDADAGGGGAASASGPGWVKVVLFVATIGIWGACDGMVAFVGRDLHQFHVAAFTAVGFALAALVSSWVSFVATAMAGPLGGAASAAAVAAAAAARGNGTASVDDAATSSSPGPSAVGEGGIEGYALLFAAQAAGICAWYSSVRLGQMSEASAFLPITSLYTLLTSVGGVLVLGESLPALGWAGIALAAVGMVLIALA